ncbi:MAG: hypothetical protein IT368_13060, partial [Candidatus Hydrogenedentes bacterium]|nr:hypothetical protein [Candidatus Hydrogenedentota bacterium]
MTFPALSELRVYQVDACDCISYVNREWLSFAQSNNGDALREEDVLGSELWSYIAGRQLRQIYREIFHHVRTHQRSIILRSRCDTPDKLRLSSLKIAPLPDSALSLECQTLEEVPRAALRILDPRVERTDELIVMCSVCKGIQSGLGKWEELEAALSAMGLLERERFPSLSHGLCPSCA